MKYSKKVFSFVMALAMVVSLLQPVTSIKAATTNVLTGKTYTNIASSSNPANAVDGNVNSYWDAGNYNNEPYITFDLGGYHLIESFNVVNYHAANDRYYYYDILISTNGTDFVSVVEKNYDDYATSAGDTFTLINPLYATHIKFVGKYNSKNTGFHFNELAAYGTEATNVSEVDIAKQSLIFVMNETHLKKDYSEESYKVYETAYAAALEVAAKTDATLNEIKDATAALANAINQLAEKERENLALNKDVYVKDIEGGYKADGTLTYEFFDPKNATDGVVDSQTMNGNRVSLDSKEGNYLQIDLGTIYDFDGVKIDYFPAGKKLEVLTSNDGETWLSAGTVEVEKPVLGTYGQLTYNFDEMATGRYVRFVQPVIQIPNMGYAYKWGVCEIEVLGYIPSLDEVNDLLEKVEEVDETLYTEESLTKLNNSVKAIEDLLKTSLSVSQIKAAYTAVKNAYEGLVLVEDEGEEVESINVASQKNGGVADADNVTVVGGDKAFLNNNVLKDAWIAASASTPVSAKIDFNKKYEVDTVRIIFKERQNKDEVLGFTVSYVDANGNTKELYKGTSYSEDNSTATLNLGHKFYSEYVLSTPVVMKGLKVTVTSNTTNEAVAIAEIQAFGKESKALEGEKNLALGASITATQQYSAGYGAGIIVDGNSTSSHSYWHSGKGLPQSFTIDLSESCTITKMVAYPYTDGERYYLYDIEVSSDGTKWEPVADREAVYGTDPSFVGETYAFTPYFNARYVRVNCTYNSNGSEEFHMREFEVYGISNAKNVALDKNVSSTNAENGTTADCITDGEISKHWDGGAASKEAPQSFTIDLESAYFIDSMKAYPYTDGSRWYDYDIEVSADGVDWQKVANRVETHGEKAAFAGEKYEFDTTVYARFIRVNMTHNSANPSVHMKEFEVFGTIDPDYVAPDYDPSDSKNLAYGKPVNSHLNTNSLGSIVDGFDETICSGAFAPAYFDIDLEENVELKDIEVKFPVKAGRYYYFTVYGSTDGTNYDRLYQERSQTLPENGLYKVDLNNEEYRIVRIYVEYVSDLKTSLLSEVRVHGTPTGENTQKLLVDYTLEDANKEGINAVESILDMESYQDSQYSAPITNTEIIENVYGIIDRIIGNEYRSWFSFELVNDSSKTKDWYSVEYDETSNKIIIKGNEGLSLSSGLNYYLENYCHVLVSEQTVNGQMPDAIVKMDTKVTKENQVEVRYAFNYCTLNYTFSYADAEEFQREYDWMALNGVNCVLDLAGQEAVWIMFLMNFGYTYDEAKDWIAGGTYYAWQFMDNMEVIGGPVADEWVAGRLEMARANQRWKVSLGMETVLQGYAGMIPNNFGDYQPDVEILEQGTWCNLPRPDMIRTDGALYDEYARLFYEAQDWAFGNTSNYYAVDPFHEGGIRPEDLTDSMIAENVLESLLKYDSEAVWMVQAWWANPTNELLKGMGENREDHVLILDLMGLNSVYNTPYWQQTSYYNGATVLEEDEFNSTSWVWCLLENYGGNPGMDGRALEAVKRIQYAYENAQHMKGLGFISEATYDNPLIYDLVFDMAWVTVEELQATTPAQFLSDWTDNWVTARYGKESENAIKAWDILLDTVYSGSSSPSQVILSTSPSLNSYGSRYSFSKLEEALELLYKDYDELSGSECYRYDLTEVMRQIVSNYATELCGDLQSAYTAADIEAFKAKKEEFLAAFDLLDEVTGTQQELLIGEWVGSAADWATDTGADDFAYDAMTINAKTLITVWAPTTYLGTYAFRHYNGIIRDIYKPIWESYLTGLEETLETGSAKTSTINYTKSCMEWIYTDWADQVQSATNRDGYIRYADNSVENMDKVVAKVLDKVIYIDPINIGNIAYQKDVTTNAERPDSPGAPGGGYASNVNDGLSDTYWDGITWQVDPGKEPYVIIDLEDEYEIDKINVLNYVSGSRYYLYDLYTSTDGDTWTKVGSREEAYGTIPSPDSGDDYIYDTDKPVARYVKLVGLRNSSNEGFHVKEIRVYGNEYVAKLPADYTKVDEALAKVPTDLSVYTDESVEALNNAVNAVVRDLDETKQTEVDAMADAIKTAITALTLKGADYTKVDEAIAKAEAIDQQYVRDFTGVRAAINAVVRDLDITKQDEVDAYAKAIEDAIAALKLGRIIEIERMEAEAGNSQPGEGADKAIDNNDNTMWHTDWYGSDREDHYFIITLDELTNINGFKLLNRQNNQVNGSVAKFDLYARVSEDAPWELVVDDGQLDINSKDYQTVDFDETDALQVKLVVLESAEDPNQPGLQFSSIAEIRIYETGKDVEPVADYTAVDAAIAAANSLNKDNYTNFETVEAAIAAVVRGKRVSEQGTVDGYAAAINEAIANLKVKDADYSGLEAAIAAAEALDKDIYKDFTDVEAAVASGKEVDKGLNITQQQIIDDAIKAIEDAMDALKLKDADYAKVEEALTKVPADLSIYTDETVKAVEDAVNAVVRGLDLTKQADVDAFAKAIEDAVNALVLKDADYTKVEEALSKVPADKDNYVDFSKVEEAVAAVVEGLDITKQADVDGYAKAIEDAISALVLKDADYSEVEEAIEAASKLNKDNYKDFSKVEAAVNAVVEGLDITKQDEVDAYAKAIIDAILALEVKDTTVDPGEPGDPAEPKPENPVQPEKPVDPEQPEEPETPVEPEKPVQPEKPQVPGNDAPEADDNVNTSDLTSVYGLLSMMVAALFGMFASRKRKED